MAEVTLDNADVFEWLRNIEEEMPKVVSNRIKRRTVTEATKHFERALQAQTPNFDTGALKRSMVRVVREYRRRGRRGARGTNKYFLGVVGPSFVSGPHAHLVEFGTGPRTTFRGYNRGEMPAQPFFESIFAAATSGGVNIFEQILRQEITREFERLARGQNVRGGG